MKHLIAILCAFHYTFASGFTFSSLSAVTPPFPGDETPKTEGNSTNEQNAGTNQTNPNKEDQQKPQEIPSLQTPPSKTINLHQSPLMLPSSVIEAGAEPTEPNTPTEEEHTKIKKKKSSKKHSSKKKKKKGKKATKGKKNKKKTSKGKNRKKHSSKKKHHLKKKAKRSKPKKASTMQENNNNNGS